jgi:murein DD-endopeptidase MepM/ murein hydrolase activator NlpD
LLILKNKFIKNYRYSKYQTQRKDRQFKKMLSFLAGILLLFFKFIIILKKVATAFLVFVIFRPLRVIFRLFFYKIVVKFFVIYRSLLKKIGWDKIENNFSTILFGQKFVHVLVISITVLLLTINLTTATKAGGFTGSADKTILSELIKSEFSQFEEDQQLIVETFDSESVISDVQQTYLDNLSAFRPQAAVSMNSADDTGMDGSMATIQDGGSIVRPDSATTQKTERQRTGNVDYTIQSGDSISTIAEEFSVSVATILWENDLSVYSVIKPGDVLTIPPVSGISHKVASGESVGTIAKKYDISEDSILEFNKLAEGGGLQVGQKLFIPGGKKISLPVPKPEKYTSGLSVLKDIVTAPSARPVPGNKMNWPTAATIITQYFSWRHYAVDIAGPIGTPIYAADAGTVELAGWGTGYGNQIVIDHGGGKKTRYAHLSKFHVSVGDKVAKGETIGDMGSTGWSTGPHVHFEVIINGTKYNPLDYIR